MKKELKKKRQIERSLSKQRDDELGWVFFFIAVISKMDILMNANYQASVQHKTALLKSDNVSCAWK
jgi:hypothetical protein